MKFERLTMNVFKYIKCLIAGHDTSDSKSIVETFCSDYWLKQCNCCGRYIMNGDGGSICISGIEALKIKDEFNELLNIRKRYEETNDTTLTQAGTDPDSYLVSVRKFKNLVNRLPDDGKIMIEVEKDYGNKIRLSLDEVNDFKMQGKVLIITCTTVV